jgi:putative ABC transport system substrate-binding protein
MPLGPTNRRTFIAAFGGAASILWSKQIMAEDIGALPKVAVIGAETDPQLAVAFEQGMREVGWIKDANVRVDYRWGGTDLERTTAAVTEVIGWNPSVVVTVASPVTLAMHRATTTIPIVFTAVSDPVGQGLVTNLAHPGGNVTGFSYFDPGMGGKWVQLLNEFIPQATHFELMFNPSTAFAGELFQRSIEEAARPLRIQVTRAPVHDDGEIKSVVERLSQTANSALLVPSDVFTYFRSAMIAALAAENRLPAIYPVRRFIEDGGLIAYGPDVYDQIRRSTFYVDRILKGANPSDLPVQQPTKYSLLINLKAANALGLAVPATLLARADEVIE